ncbi:MAG TPA: TetR/AcrR family transcriptional regulator [Caulobacteraceae bacterium]|nr:TetR/AcrR family transcriptional regulator [Caulobacteraceae bacterium]
MDAPPMKDTPKSRRTRARILAAATQLLAEVGYHAAANAIIAEAAGITRGAMLYHFPAREDLLDAVIEHIQAERLALFDAAAADPPPGVDATAHAIAAYWRLLNEAPFVAFAELEAVARTDPMVRARIAPAQAAFDQVQLGAPFSAIAQAGQGPRLQASRDLARFLLEGLARANLTYERDGRVRNLIAVVDRAVRMLNRKGDVQELWPD